LEGRGALKADPDAAFSEITNPPPVGKGVEFETGVIKKRATEVFTQCMPEVAARAKGTRWRNVVDDEGSYWARRHEHCVNGSHHLPTGVKDFSYDGTKTRMAYLEKMQQSTLFKTEPIIEATLSQKIENPKIRDILGADTLSYLNEDYIMKGVERVWHSDSILLSPGDTSRLAELERVSNMSGKTYVMLDYAAMDRQASIKSQLEVIDALCDFLDAPDHVREWFMEANANQWVRFGTRRGKITFGLLTGRRMTTFMNTVLNVCYFREAVDMNLVSSSMHAGDDIVLRCAGRSTGRKILEQALSSKSNFNPRKQSLGEAAEFLRMAVKGDVGLCYLNRTIASCVCGNWVNKMRLAETDLISQFSLFSWTLDNRGMMKNYAHNLLRFSCHQRCKISKGLASGVCKNEVSVNNSPVRTTNSVVKLIRTATGVEIDEVALKRQESHASSSDVDELLRLQPRNVVTQSDAQMIKTALKRASYTKSLHVGNVPRKFTHHVVQRRITHRFMDKHVLEQRTIGVASKHPLVTIIRSIFNRHMSEILGVILTGRRPPVGVDLDTWIYGAPSVIVNGNTGMDYNDLSIMGNVLSKTSDDVVDVSAKHILHT
jgi:hypothetical protein